MSGRRTGPGGRGSSTPVCVLRLLPGLLAPQLPDENLADRIAIQHLAAAAGAVPRIVRRRPRRILLARFLVLVSALPAFDAVLQQVGGGDGAATCVNRFTTVAVSPGQNSFFRSLQGIRRSVHYHNVARF